MARGKSREAHERIIHAAVTLFGKQGIDATTMDGIARVARVGKATIYNHWQDKEKLLMEVMCYLHEITDNPEDVDTGNLAADLASVLNRRPSAALQAARDQLMPELIAYSAKHPAFGQAWRVRVMEPPRLCLTRVLERGQTRGELPADLDHETAIALLLGPMLYRHIFNKGPKPRETREQKDSVGRAVAESFCRAWKSSR